MSSYRYHGGTNGLDMAAHELTYLFGSDVWVRQVEGGKERFWKFCLACCSCSAMSVLKKRSRRVWRQKMVLGGFLGEAWDVLWKEGGALGGVCGEGEVGEVERGFLCDFRRGFVGWLVGWLAERKRGNFMLGEWLFTMTRERSEG